MAEFSNGIGFEPSPRARKLWTAIKKSDSDCISFKLPALYKSVTPFIVIYVIGFIFIFLMEGYATFGIAMQEGVPILVIGILILVDILFAYLPHLFDEAICIAKNNLFVCEYSLEFKRLDKSASDEDYRQKTATSKDYFSSKIAKLTTYRNSLYSLVILSACVKLYLFFQTYPFFDSYQAYIVILAYVLGAVLHIICTGNIINYYFRFRPKLKRDLARFRRTNGKELFYSNNPLVLIDSMVKIEPTEIGKHNQTIIMKDDQYYVKYSGILFDEELNDLINQQTNYEQKISVATMGKRIQLGMLNVDGQNR